MSICPIIFKTKITIAQGLDIFESNHQETEFSPSSRIHNKFMYEFLPTIGLASKLHAQSFSVMENVGLAYDAILHFDNHADIYIEWVSAIPHEEAKIKLQQLEQFKMVSIFEDLDVKQLNRQRVTPSPCHTSNDHEDLIAYGKKHISNLLIKVFNKKNQKLKAGRYDPEITLGIVYDDLGLNGVIVSDALKIAQLHIDSREKSSFKEVHLISLRECHNLADWYAQNHIKK